MVVEWYTKAQEHWDEQLDYCAEAFGVKVALDCEKQQRKRLKEFVSSQNQEHENLF